MVITFDYGIIIAHWQNAVITFGCLVVGLIEFWLLKKIDNVLKLKRITFNLKNDKQVYEIGGESYNQSYPVRPINQINDYCTNGEDNNIANKYPKEKCSSLSIQSHTSLRGKVRDIIGRLTTKCK